ncbi:MAG: sulfotransferase [Thiolinea sp.]
MHKQLVCVTGLPRSGSTLMCQLLGLHPDIYSLGHSSPLLQTLNQLRHNLSDNEFLLSQMDVNFDLAYQRLVNAFRGFANGWFAESDKSVVVDKNRGWLNQLDLAQLLNPQSRMLVCVRELGQIIGSIEAQHQKTLLLDFPDHLATHSRYGRADAWVKDNGVVGAPLRSIEAMQDIPESLQKNVYYVVFEHLMQEPSLVMQGVFHWLQLDAVQLNLASLPVTPHESDSYYRFKYLHKTQNHLQAPAVHLISPRIQAELERNFPWFYQTFYPAKAL